MAAQQPLIQPVVERPTGQICYTPGSFLVFDSSNGGEVTCSSASMWDVLKGRTWAGVPPAETFGADLDFASKNSKNCAFNLGGGFSRQTTTDEGVESPGDFCRQFSERSEAETEFGSEGQGSSPDSFKGLQAVVEADNLEWPGHAEEQAPKEEEEQADLQLLLNVAGMQCCVRNTFLEFGPASSQHVRARSWGPRSLSR